MKERSWGRGGGWVGGREVYINNKEGGGGGGGGAVRVLPPL
jgi:hypothetical protein